MKEMGPELEQLLLEQMAVKKLEDKINDQDPTFFLRESERQAFEREDKIDRKVAIITK